MRVNGIDLRELSQRDVMMMLRKLTSGSIHLTVRPVFHHMYAHYSHLPHLSDSVDRLVADTEGGQGDHAPPQKPMSGRRTSCSIRTNNCVYRIQDCEGASEHSLS